MAPDAPAPHRLRRLQDADLDGKVVLVRVDHNCVRRGSLTDAFRVDATVATLYNIVERGGRPVLMTHVGRPYDKKTKPSPSTTTTPRRASRGTCRLVWA
jgi:phosphoglycerate kinase